MARISDFEGREAEVLASLVSFEERAVLDVGCGEGRTSRTIARTAASVTGIDPDADVALVPYPKPKLALMTATPERR